MEQWAASSRRESAFDNGGYAHCGHSGTSCSEKLFDQDEIKHFGRETAMGVTGIGGCS